MVGDWLWPLGDPSRRGLLASELMLGDSELVVYASMGTAVNEKAREECF